MNNKQWKERPASRGFSPPTLTKEDYEAVVEVLKSGWITTGPKVQEFEEAIKLFCKAQGCIGVSSCTGGLQTILRVLGVGPGDEVITTPFTYSASASVIHHVGANIVFADIEPGSFHISPQEVYKCITPKTKAIISVDYGGIPCQYDEIFQVLKENVHSFQPKSGSLLEKYGRLPLVADGAHSFGAAYCGNPVGGIADFTSFSFHAVKNLTTGEGGAITFNNSPINEDELRKIFYLYIMHGQDRDALSRLQGGWRYDIKFLGYKYNMCDILAALGLSQLKRYDETLARRKELFNCYIEYLEGESHLVLPSFDVEKLTSSFHLFPLRVSGWEEEDRDKLMLYLRENNIPANVHFVPLPMHSAYQKLGFDMAEYPHSYNQYKNLITLPLHLELEKADVEFICSRIIHYFKEN